MLKLSQTWPASGGLSSGKTWFLNGTRWPVASGQLWSPPWGWQSCCPPACSLTWRITLCGESHTVCLWGSAFPQWQLSDSGGLFTLDGCCHVENLGHLPKGSVPWPRPPSPLIQTAMHKQPHLSPSSVVPGTQTGPNFLPLPLSSISTSQIRGRWSSFLPITVVRMKWKQHMWNHAWHKTGAYEFSPPLSLPPSLPPLRCISLERGLPKRQVWSHKTPC